MPVRALPPQEVLLVALQATEAALDVEPLAARSTLARAGQALSKVTMSATRHHQIELLIGDASLALIDGDPARARTDVEHAVKLVAPLA